MQGHLVISARVPEELKRRLEEAGVNISGVVRRSLEVELKRLEIDRLQKPAEDSAHMLDKIPPDEISKAIRSGRESR